jgi:hypothetical protein
MMFDTMPSIFTASFSILYHFELELFGRAGGVTCASDRLDDRPNAWDMT